jgi:hypothetical protein
MKSFDDLLDQKEPGSSFWVSAEALGLDPAHFHDLATRWAHAGGGDGFTVVGAPHMPSNATFMIDLLMLRKDHH